MFHGEMGLGRVEWGDLIKWRHWGLPSGRHAAIRLFHFEFCFELVCSWRSQLLKSVIVQFLFSCSGI